MSARYRTIVADPPWDQGGTGVIFGRGMGPSSPHTWEPFERGESTPLPYGTMTLDEIKALPVSDLAEPNAHLYLWTTQKFLRESWEVAEAWGFRVSTTLVWCKRPMGNFLGGPFPASTEFVQFCRRGTLAAHGKAEARWFTWPRIRMASVKRGELRQGGHSYKPDAFLDVVERVSPGPYAELFARRARLGWGYPIGDESLGGVAA